jgi:hypothetical protein
MLKAVNPAATAASVVKDRRLLRRILRVASLIHLPIGFSSVYNAAVFQPDQPVDLIQ